MAFDGFFHFRSSIIPGSASRISARIRESVSPRQSPSSRIRSLISIDSRPDEQFAKAAITQITERRNAIAANVATGNRPALLAVSRPFFDGYRATIDGRPAPISSYRGLMPLVEVGRGRKAPEDVTAAKLRAHASLVRFSASLA